MTTEEQTLLEYLQTKYNKPGFILLSFARLVDAVDLVSVPCCRGGRFCGCNNDCSYGLEQNLNINRLKSSLELLDERMKMPSPCRCTQYSTCFLSWSRMEECARRHDLKDAEQAELKPVYAEIKEAQNIVYSFSEDPEKVAAAKVRLETARAKHKKISDAYLLKSLTLK